jgi:hypothetical protein
MKALRVCPLSEKAFPAAGEQSSCRLARGGVREGKQAERRPRRKRGRPVRNFTFVVKMYGLNVAQGWEQYSLKNDARRLDIGDELM